MLGIAHAVHYREVQRELLRQGASLRPDLRELIEACERPDGVAQDAR